MAEGSWIVSRRADLAMLGIPALITLLVLGLPRPDSLSLAWFLLLVVAFDVAHVWSTLYLSYLDPGALRRRPWLFLLPIPLCLLLSYRLHQHSPVLFWTLVAYLAIHHFASQQYGFVALYKLRAGERDPLDRVLDKLTLWTGALGPVLWWHTTDDFDWFGHGERFLLRLDPGLRPDIGVLMASVALLYLLRQLRLAQQGRFCLGKNLWMGASWLSWSLGIAWAEHPLVSLACINLLHGIPFLILVWFRCRRREEGPAPAGGLLSWLARRAWAFYGLVFLLALLEEVAWERFLWGNYLPQAELSSQARSACLALLVTPQLVHYFLDAWLWKLDGSNPDLEQALGRPPRAESAETGGH